MMKRPSGRCTQADGILGVEINVYGLGRQNAGNLMSVTLIVTKSMDRSHRTTGDSISEPDWLAFIESDALLTLRTQPFEVTAPSGCVIQIPAQLGQSEMTLGDGTRLPFLAWFAGKLSMRLYPEMKDAANPVRQKVAQIARHFNALITTDACDEFLEW